MFEPMVLPVRITSFVLLALFVCLSLILRRFTKHPVLSSITTCIVAGLPLLFLVGFLVDSVRYGEFHYADAKGLNDGYVSLPAEATGVTLHKYASGHALKFKTSESSLTAWMNTLTQQRLEYTDATPFRLEEEEDGFLAEEFKNLFHRQGWSPPADVVVYRGWRSGRGGGFDVWFSKAGETAYISAGYW
jgi:hypothetical protein